MNVGFRPRLKARPSLYDLVRSRNIDQLSVRPSTPTRAAFEFPPLPASPSPSTPSTPSEVKQLGIPLVQEAIKMAKKEQQLDGEEQYGERFLDLAPWDNQANDDFQARFIPSLGMQLRNWGRSVY